MVRIQSVLLEALVVILIFEGRPSRFGEASDITCFGRYISWCTQVLCARKLAVSILSQARTCELPELCLALARTNCNKSVRLNCLRLNELNLCHSNPVSLATAQNPPQTILIRRHAFSSVSHPARCPHDVGRARLRLRHRPVSVQLCCSPQAAAAASPPVFSWSFAITGGPRRAFIYINLSGRGVRLPEACQGSVPNARPDAR